MTNLQILIIIYCFPLIAYIICSLVEKTITEDNTPLYCNSIPNIEHYLFFPLLNYFFIVGLISSIIEDYNEH